MRNLSQQIRDLIARHHALSRVRIHVQGTSVWGRDGQASSKGVLVRFVQVHKTPIGVWTELQSLARITPKLSPRSILVNVGPISLDIVGCSICFGPEVSIGVIKPILVFSDPFHRFYNFVPKSTSGRFRPLASFRNVFELSMIKSSPSHLNKR